MFLRTIFDQKNNSSSSIVFILGGVGSGLLAGLIYGSLGLLISKYVLAVTLLNPLTIGVSLGLLFVTSGIFYKKLPQVLIEPFVKLGLWIVFGTKKGLSAYKELPENTPDVTIDSLPPELMNNVLQFFPMIVEQRQLRQVNQTFFHAFEDVAKYQLRNSTPLISNRGVEEGYNILYSNQKLEISYLIQNQASILEKNGDNLELKKVFEKLILLKDSMRFLAYDAKEKCINNINEMIVRNKIIIAREGDNSTVLKCKTLHLTRFPESLFKDNNFKEFWAKLTELNISDNQLSALPDTLGQCISLKKLKVSKNQLTALPATIGQCIALKKLKASNNQLTVLPDPIGQCVALKKLNVSNNQLTALPDSIGQCTALKELFVDNNQLTALPDAMRQCIALKVLYVHNNQLTALFDAIGQYTALEWFIVSNNQLTILPDAIGQCTALEFLFADNNQLTTLPDAIGQCTALEYLIVHNNQLTSLPATIGQCTALKELKVSKNRLTALPDSIGQCTALEWLSADNNQLIALPDSIGQCTALKELYLDNNLLIALPDSIGQCTALRELKVLKRIRNVF